VRFGRLASAPEPESSPPRAGSLLGAALWAPLSRRCALWVGLLFGAETLAYALIRLPTDLGFDANAFGDRGDFLSISNLVGHGSRPAIDFGYHWGLVPIMLAQAWFALFGATPQTNEAVMVVCALLVAIGVARMAAALRLGTLGIAFLVIALPFAFPTFTVTYALEAVLLSNALAEQAAGRCSTALALTTSACFVKPSMAYVYGFVLVVLALRDAWRSEPGASSIDWRKLMRTITPAAITACALILILAAIYGTSALATTLLPRAGMSAYRSQGMGFFHGAGRDFWYQPRLGLPFYVFTVAGWWLAGTLWLVAAGLRGGWKLIIGIPYARSSAADEFVLTCAILQVAFITVFFGTQVSWRYYCYILVMGVAATSIRDLLAARIVKLLACLALLGHLSHFAELRTQWRSTAPSSVTAGMWASPEEVHEWQQVQRAIDGHRTLLLTAMGCGPVLSAQFEQPFADHFNPGELMPGQLARLMRHIDSAQRIVVVISAGFGDMLVWWPDIQRALDGHELLWKGQSFAVYGARSSSAATRAP
jgi:hypothetical protein